MNLSCVDLPVVEKFVAEKLDGRPLVFLNNELDTLRADLGLFSFPEKDLHYRFLSNIKPVYYLRTRAYSRTINVSPFVINYSGAIFREYPAPWQVMVKQTGGLVRRGRGPILAGEAKEGMPPRRDEDGSTMQFLHSGYKTNTWWEDECDQEQFDAWRTERPRGA